MKTETVTTTIYTAKDGRRFKDRGECEAYEVELNRTDSFSALKAKVDAIECLENSNAPFGCGYVDDERYEYRWYRPKNFEEVEALNSFFSITVQQDKNIAEIVGKWVGIEIDGDYDEYTGKEDVYNVTALDRSNEMLVKFYAALGYDVKIEKQESAVIVRDKALEDLWEQLTDVPMNAETECIEEPFIHFPEGTHREEIWRWFDTQHSKGVAYLMCGDNSRGGGITREKSISDKAW